MISRKRINICSVLASELMLLAISANTSITGKRSPWSRDAIPMAEMGMC
jgi:hypothetical protein